MGAIIFYPSSYILQEYSKRITVVVSRDGFSCKMVILCKHNCNSTMFLKRTSNVWAFRDGIQQTVNVAESRDGFSCERYEWETVQ